MSPPPAEYLRDESRQTGRAEAIAFPRSEAEVAEVLAAAARKGLPVTIQGARTGITAGAVPDGGLILNLSHLNRIEPAGESELRAGAGATLTAIRAAVPAGWMFTPDPTETSASIGGMISCNASGALSYRYGPTRRHIAGLRAVLASGETVDLRRGRDRARGWQFALGPIRGELPELPRPAVKNAAGYFTEADMDLLDLFIGGEGTLGVITEATLRLLPAPGAIWALMAFLPDTASGVRYVQWLRAQPREADAAVAAIEYFDAHSLLHLRAHAEDLATKGLPIPGVPAGFCCVYSEWHALGADAAEAAVLAAAEQLPEFGADPDAALLADNAAELEKLKLLRHAVPELVNSLIDQRRKIHPNLIKLGTDMSVPDPRLADMMRRYEQDLAAAGLEHVIFGHIGANHLHVNILPRQPEDYTAGRELYRRWAAQVLAWGGSISAEHGIGKLKRDLFRQMVGEDALARMRNLKKLFDPQGRLNPGTLFEL